MSPMKHMKPDETSVWPDPSTVDELEWQLRYGGPDRTTLLAAASVVSAYRYLLGCTRERIAQVRRTALAGVRRESGAGGVPWRDPSGGGA